MTVHLAEHIGYCSGDPIQAKSKSAFLALLATIFWATAATAFKMGLHYFHGQVALLLLWSVIFSFLCLTALRLLNHRRHPLDLRAWQPSLLMGLVNPVLYYLILLEAYNRLPGSEAQPLNFTWPIVLSILSVAVLKQPFKWSQIISILFGFSGVLIISTRGNPLSLHLTDPFGVMLAVGSSLFWAVYWIANMKDRRDALTKMIWNFFFGMLYLLFYCVIRGQIHIPDWQGLLCAAWIGFFEMGITFYIWMRALELAPSASHISQLVYLSPFISLILLNLVIHENIAISSIWGLMLILSGILINQIDAVKSNYRKLKNMKQT